MKQFLRTLCLLATPLVVIACNSDYNFDNISLEVTVGNTEGIVVPLGSTGEITLGSLLGESGIESDANGNYGFSFADHLSYTLELGTIDPIVGLVPALTPVSTSLIGNINASIPTFEESKSLSLPSGITAEMEIPEGFPLLGQEFTMHYDPNTFEGEFSVEVPEEVAAIRTIRFGADGQGSLLEINFSLGGLVGITDSRVINKFDIELPAGFTLEKVPGDPVYNSTTISCGEGSSTPNRFNIENYSMTSDELSIAILIKSVDLSATTSRDGNILTIDEDVTYDLDFTGTFKAGKVTSVAPEVAIVANLEVFDATITTNEFSHPVEISENISQSITLPQEVKEIRAIALVDYNTGEAPKLTIQLGVENSPVSFIELQNLEINLPPYLQVSPITPGWDYLDGKLTAETLRLDTAGSGQITIGEFTIEGIGALDINNGELNLSSEIGLKGDFVLPAGQDITLALHHEDIVITPVITLSDMKVESITGIVEPDLESLLEPIEVSLGDFTSAMEGLDLELNLASPRLDISIDNPIGIGIDAELKIEAYKAGAVAKSVTTPTIFILPASQTNLIIVGESGDWAYPDDAGTQVCVVEGLTDIIGLLPDKIVLSINAETNKTTPHHIALQDSYTFNISYGVDAPLAFSSNKDGHIAYTTTIEGVDLTELADIDLIIEKLTIQIASKSTLPIDLELDVTLLDENGEPIQSVTSTTTGLVKGTTSQEPESSECAITLNIAAPSQESSTLTPFADIARTQAVECTLRGTTLAGGALNANQYIDLSLALLLDEGITVDLGTIGSSAKSE